MGTLINIRAAIAIAIPVLAAGCVSDSPRADGDAAVPPERLYSAQLLQPFPGAATITVKKMGGGLLEGACFGRLILENRAVAEMHGSEQVVLYLAQGQYSIAYVPKGVCQGKPSRIEIQLRANETRMFFIDNGSRGDFSIVEIER